jgi:glycosyltransferase involved in cell wall biosynthesis
VTPPYRILFVSPALETGGAERHLSILLPALRDRGFRPAMLTLAGEGHFFDELRAAGIDTSCARMRARTDIRGLRRALSLSRPAPDLVVSQSVSALVVGQLLATRSRAPHLEIEHSPPGFGLRPHQWPLVRAFAPRVDCVVAVSQAQLPRLIRLGYRSERIRVIPNGVPQLEPVRSRRAVRSELQLQDGDFVAVLLAFLSSRKRADLFLRSVVEANKSDERIRGVIVGDGPDLSRIFDLAAHANGVVQVLGDRTDIADLLNSSDVVCLTSAPGGEAMPLALIEAMSVGRPVISTDVGGVREIVVADATGVVIPAGANGRQLVSALLGLAADPKRAETLGRAGRDRYQKVFQSDRMVDNYADIFSELAQVSARRKR